MKDYESQAGGPNKWCLAGLQFRIYLTFNGSNTLASQVFFLSSPLEAEVLEPRSTDKVTKFQHRLHAGFDSLLFGAPVRGMKDKHTFLRQRHLTFGCVTQDERRTQPPNFSPELALPSRLTFLLLPSQIKPLSHSQPSLKTAFTTSPRLPSPCQLFARVRVFGGEEKGLMKHTCFALLGKSLFSFASQA